MAMPPVLQEKKQGKSHGNQKDSLKNSPTGKKEMWGWLRKQREVLQTQVGKDERATTELEGKQIEVHPWSSGSFSGTDQSFWQCLGVIWNVRVLPQKFHFCSAMKMWFRMWPNPMWFTGLDNFGFMVKNMLIVNGVAKMGKPHQVSWNSF